MLICGGMAGASITPARMRTTMGARADEGHSACRGKSSFTGKNFGRGRWIPIRHLHAQLMGADGQPLERQPVEMPPRSRPRNIGAWRPSSPWLATRMKLCRAFLLPESRDAHCFGFGTPGTKAQ